MNIRKLIILIIATFGASASSVADNFDAWFYHKTMRFDYYHAGSATTETIYFDELREEPYYAGSHEALVDTHNYGQYRFSLRDKKSGKLIYQRGYDNLMKEWRTTPEAKTMQRAMPESIVFPYPRKAVTLTIEARDRKNNFQTLYTQDLDPESHYIRRFSPTLESFDVAYQGAPEHCVDLVLIPEGYAAGERATFEADCRVFCESLFSYAPYKDNEQRFNVRGVWAPSVQSGVTMPGEDIWRNTACGVQYYTFYSERYQMTDDMQRLRDIAAHVPYEYIYIISNSQKYGGGAIYNWYGISAAHIHANPAAIRKTYAHEFGHLFLGLGDEYVGGSDTELYEPGVEPWEENLTALVNGKCKWADMMEANTPLPTPIPEGYQREQAHEMSEWKLGAYEGGGYIEKGIYRPMPNCMMNWMHTQDLFCPVCDRAIRNYIEFLTK